MYLLFIYWVLMSRRQVLDVVEALNPETSKWRHLPAMPTPRCGCCACAVGHHLVVLGGQLADGTVLDKATAPRPRPHRRQVELLDVHAMHWHCLPALPSPRSGAGAAAHAGKVYLLGGLGASGLTVPVVDRLDLQAPGNRLPRHFEAGKPTKTIGKLWKTSDFPRFPTHFL